MLKQHLKLDAELRFAGYSELRVSAMVAVDAAALCRGNLKPVMAAQVPRRQIWIGTANAVIVTTMLEHCIRMLLASVFKFTVTDNKYLLCIRAGKDNDFVDETSQKHEAAN